MMATAAHLQMSQDGSVSANLGKRKRSDSEDNNLDKSKVADQNATQKRIQSIYGLLRK